MEFEAFLILKEKSFHQSVLPPKFHSVSPDPGLLSSGHPIARRRIAQ